MKKARINFLQILVFCFLALVCLILPRPVKAAFTFEVVGATPTVITSKEDVVVVTLSITDLPSESYFRVAWQESGGKPYFGYIKNDKGEWTQIKSLSSGDCGDYYKVSDLSTSSIQLEVKMGQDSDVLPGQYLLKAHRFTASCSSYTASSEASDTSVTANIPTPTPTLTATPIPTPTPIPTKTPTPSPLATKKPTPKPTATSKASPAPGASDTPAVLAASISSTPTPTDQSESNGGVGWMPLVFVGGGLALATTGGVLFVKQRKSGYTGNSEKVT